MGSQLRPPNPDPWGPLPLQGPPLFPCAVPGTGVRPYLTPVSKSEVLTLGRSLAPSPVSRLRGVAEGSGGNPALLLPGPVSLSLPCPSSWPAPNSFMSPAAPCPLSFPAPWPQVPSGCKNQDLGPSQLFVLRNRDKPR